MWVNAVSSVTENRQVAFNNFATQPIKAEKKERVENTYAPITMNLWGEKKSNNNMQFGVFIPNFGRISNNPVDMDPKEADTQSGFKLSMLTEPLPCPDCGAPIMTKPIFNGIKKELNEADESSYLKVIRKNIDYVMPQERKILSFLEVEKAKNPDKTIKDIVSDERTERLAKLERRQYHVLDNMGKFAEEMQEEDKSKVQTLLKESSGIIFERQSNFAFQRGKFLELINALDLSKQEDKEKLVKIAEKLPSSRNSETAWFVKYGGLDNKKQERNSRDIVEKLVSPTYTNTDHVHPHDLGGLDAVSNFWLMHARCNIIKTNKPFEQWLNEDKTNRSEYIHWYLKDAQAAIDASDDPKIHPKYDHYSAKLAQTIYNETNGKLDFTEEFPLPEEEKSNKTNEKAA